MTLLEVLQARRRIAPYVRRTPLVRSSWLSDLSGADVWLKLESAQHSHSFKWRGAFNAVIARLERGTPKLARLVTASAGNHGRALAAAAETFGLPLTVFTPADAPQVKLMAIARHGAELRADSRDYDEAERRAKAFASETGAAFISPYSDRRRDRRRGDGRARDLRGRRGYGHARRSHWRRRADQRRGRRRQGRQPLGAPSSASRSRRPVPFQTSVRAGRLVEIVPGPTLADGLAGNPDPDTITFEPIQRLVDQLVTVSEKDLEDALVGLVTAEHVDHRRRRRRRHRRPSSGSASMSRDAAWR